MLLTKVWANKSMIWSITIFLVHCVAPRPLVHKHATINVRHKTTNRLHPRATSTHVIAPRHGPSLFLLALSWSDHVRQRTAPSAVCFPSPTHSAIRRAVSQHGCWHQSQRDSYGSVSPWVTTLNLIIIKYRFMIVTAETDLDAIINDVPIMMSNDVLQRPVRLSASVWCTCSTPPSIVFLVQFTQGWESQ